MKVAVFDTHKFDRAALENANNNLHHLIFLEVRLSKDTAILAQGCEGISCFANDTVDAATLEILHRQGVKFIALRTAGFNQVDLDCANKFRMTVVRVPEYSPYSVAEFAVGLLMTFNRKIHKAHNRVHELNFALDGLVGFDLHQKTVGVIGTGRIGKIFCKIMKGFGCRVLAYDVGPDEAWANSAQVEYVNKQKLFQESDVISLHVPLNKDTRHIIDGDAIRNFKKNTLLINTGRGALIETRSLIQALKSHSIGGACLDVYEEEAGVFFSDLSDKGIDDDVLARLLTFPNVLMTSHQGFLTQEALKNIAEITIENISRFEKGLDLEKVLVSENNRPSELKTTSDKQ